MTRTPRTPLRLAISALLLAGLSACAVIPDPPSPESAALAQGTPVALGQAVTVGPVVATPMAVVEHSRCPVNARCVWAGRLVVTTRIDGPGWRDTADLTLGEPWSTHGVGIALAAGEPGRMAGEGQETPKGAYRFTYEAR
ncbi:hypothetical protein [Porphyrobacter sp. AAP82]|uniref:hypothetical protein n=1 Tax=Porphyrobacter sp. AAP82 TaxID=1248917 RepID=UPI00035F7CED|nr:hypothetical protein [Porphyrobacter sp. AAP82]